MFFAVAIISAISSTAKLHLISSLFSVRDNWLCLQGGMRNVYCLPLSLLFSVYSFWYTQLCLLLHLTELSLKTSNFSLVFKHHSSTHLFLKAKMFPIMILTLTRDIQQLKYTSTNPRKKTWKEMSVNSASVKRQGEKNSYVSAQWGQKLQLY